MKFLKFLKRHMFFTVATVIFLILVIVGVIVCKNLFFSSNGNKYGHRLDGIEQHEINGDQSARIVNSIKEDDRVVSASYTLTGRRIDVLYTVKGDVDADTAKSFANKILDVLEDEQEKYYDIEIFISCESAENEIYPIAGYKNKSASEIRWS